MHDRIMSYYSHERILHKQLSLLNQQNKDLIQ